MSITAIIALIFSVLGALLGGLLMHPISKASGRKEGAASAEQKQEVTQAKEVVKATQERTNADLDVADDADSELDARLSKYNRAD